MSAVKANSIQIGQSGTASQNFVLTVPAVPDGSFKLARGNIGATTQDILSVDANGRIAFVGLQALGNYANDAAATSGGVAVGGMYRNGSVLMIRVA